MELAQVVVVVGEWVKAPELVGGRDLVPVLAQVVVQVQAGLVLGLELVRWVQQKQVVCTWNKFKFKASR